MKRFVIIVNGFQPLTIITKRSILDVAAVLDPPLVVKKSNNVKSDVSIDFEILCASYIFCKVVCIT